jgi:hypothetical protein
MISFFAFKWIFLSRNQTSHNINSYDGDILKKNADGNGGDRITDFLALQQLEKQQFQPLHRGRRHGDGQAIQRPDRRG